MTHHLCHLEPSRQRPDVSRVVPEVGLDVRLRDGGGRRRLGGVVGTGPVGTGPVGPRLEIHAGYALQSL